MSEIHHCVRSLNKNAQHLTIEVEKEALAKTALMLDDNDGNFPGFFFIPENWELPENFRDSQNTNFCD